VSPAHDEIVGVLKECEQRLRSLTENGRLTEGALNAFVELSRKVRAELERRNNVDRRRTPRNTPDRRVNPVPVTETPSGL
jgi:hypothetical protein